jgi:hypothetical protein
MEDHLERFDKQEGENWRNDRHEYGRLVRIAQPRPPYDQYPLTNYSFSISSGIIAFLKIISLKDITDIRCQSAVPYPPPMPAVIIPGLNLTACQQPQLWT